MAIAVAVCIITYRRPRGLEGLLAALARQHGVAAQGVLIVVVDNDVERTALPVVDSARRQGLTIEYDHEPVPGIPRARNRSVENALRAGAARLCFIDDDELPADDWLTRLLDHATASGAPIVAGPVLSTFPPHSPRWIESSRLFARPRHGTGHRLDRAATNNVMVERRVFDSMSEWFDESMALTGGTDTDFFRRAHLTGFAIEWCDEALVYEDVPAERCNLRWIARRNLRGGMGFARLTREHGPGLAGVLRNLVIGCARVVVGALLAVVSLGLVPLLRLRAVENLALGLGLLLGTFDARLEEYRRPTRSQAADG